MRGQKIIAMQRSVIDRVLAEKGDRLPEEERIILRLDLLAVTADELKESQPDMALLLLGDAIEIAQRNHLDVSKDIERLMRSLLIAKDVELPENAIPASELLSLAKEQIEFPVSGSESTVFGGPVDDVLNFGVDQSIEADVGSGG